MKIKYKNVDEYIESREGIEKQYLIELRSLIKDCLPEAEEKLAWNMPSYKEGKYIVHFDSYKDHVNVYIGSERIEKFQNELKGLKKLKSGIQLSFNEVMPKKQLINIVMLCAKEIRGE